MYVIICILTYICACAYDGMCIYANIKSCPRHGMPSSWKRVMRVGITCCCDQRGDVHVCFALMGFDDERHTAYTFQLCFLLLSRAKREPSPDREDWTPDDWADEEKAKADNAFKEVIILYSVALQSKCRVAHVVLPSTQCEPFIIHYCRS